MNVAQLRRLLEDQGVISAALSLADQELEEEAWAAIIVFQDEPDLIEASLLADDIRHFRHLRGQGERAQSPAYEVLNGFALHDADSANDFFWGHLINDYPRDVGPPEFEVHAYLDLVFSKLPLNRVAGAAHKVDALLQRHFITNYDEISEIRKRMVEVLVDRGDLGLAEKYLLERGHDLHRIDSRVCAMWLLVAMKSSSEETKRRTVNVLSEYKNHLIAERKDWVGYRAVVEGYLFEYVNSLDRFDGASAAKLLPSVVAALSYEGRHEWAPKDYLPLIRDTVTLEDATMSLIDIGLYERGRDHILRLQRLRELENPMNEEWVDETIEALSGPRIASLISAGESAVLEFKSTLRIDLKTNKYEKHISHAALKTVAAFLNTKGGQLVIGVGPDNKIIGISADKYTDSDEWERALWGKIRSEFGGSVADLVDAKIVEHESKQLCLVDVRKSGEPEFLGKGKEEKFYVRHGNSTNELTGRELAKYLKQHFPDG